MKTMILVAALFMAASGCAQAGCDTEPCEWRATCVGVVYNEPLYHLSISEAGVCASPFGAPSPDTLDTAVINNVLKVCAVGDRCRITGTIAGHGWISWWKIRSVKKMPSYGPEVSEVRSTHPERYTKERLERNNCSLVFINPPCLPAKRT